MTTTLVTHMRATRAMIASQLRLLARDHASLTFAIALPLLLLVLLYSIPSMKEPLAGSDELRVLDVAMAPMCIGIALLLTTLQIVPQFMATARSKGILRRLSTTPATPAGLLAAHVVAGAVLCGLGTLAVIAAGLAIFRLSPPSAPLAMLVVCLLAIGSMLSISVFIGGLARTTTGASVVGTLLLLPMMFLSGTMIPAQDLPGAIRRIGEFLPSGAAMEALTAAWSGAAIPAQPIAVMLVTIAAGWPLALATFRWE